MNYPLRSVPLRHALAGARRRVPADQQGQSLTELAIFMPLLVLFVLIAANVGLALHAQTTLTQVTQQAAQYLLHHPADTSGCSTPVQVSCVQAVTDSEVVTYLDNAGFHQSTVAVAFGQTPSGSQKATISVTYSFPVIAPILDTLNAGAFQHGTIALGTSAATIVATAAPAITAVTPVYAGSIFKGYQLTWMPPANPAGVGLRYRIYSQALPIAWFPSAGTTTASTARSYTDTCGSGGSPACTAAPSAYYSYHVVAVQTNGMASPASAEVHSS